MIEDLVCWFCQAEAQVASLLPSIWNQSGSVGALSDIVWWDDAAKNLQMVELTVPQAAAERKETNYEDLVNRARQAGYNTHLITVEVGARGVPHMAGFRKLKQEIGLNRTELSSLLSSVSQKAIEGSFQIWCSKNRIT